MYTNGQDDRRHALLGLDRTRNWGIASFDGLTVEVLDTLIAEGFADPDDCQNASPSIKEFRDFMAAHPKVTAHGYIVSNQRSDRRVSLEGLNSGTDDPAEQVEFLEWNAERGADELDRNRSWWD